MERTDDAGRVADEGRSRQAALEEELRFSVWTALAGIGTAHGGKRAAGHLASDLARAVAPRAIRYMIDRGWQFRHRTWPAGAFLGPPDGRASHGGSTGRYMGGSGGG